MKLRDDITGQYLEYSDRSSHVSPSDSTSDGWYVGEGWYGAEYSTSLGEFPVSGLRGGFTGINEHKVMVTRGGDLYDPIANIRRSMGNFTAREINGSNWVVGERAVGTNFQPVIWRNGVLADLELPSNTTTGRALEIREDGVAFGVTGPSSTLTVWNAAGQPHQYSEFTSTTRLGLTDGGALTVSGFRNGSYGSWLLEEEGWTSFDDIVPFFTYSPYGVYRLTAISDEGMVIMGAMTYYNDDYWPVAGYHHVYGKLTATPEPSSILGLGGLLALVVRLRKK